jgi:hypothetical protein
LNASVSTPVRKTCRQAAARLSAVSLNLVYDGGCAPKPPILCGGGLDFGGELELHPKSSCAFTFGASRSPLRGEDEVLALHDGASPHTQAFATQMP